MNPIKNPKLGLKICWGPPEKFANILIPIRPNNTYNPWDMHPSLGPKRSPDSKVNMLCRVIETSPMGMLKKAPIAVNDVNKDTITISLIDKFILSLLNILELY